MTNPDKTWRKSSYTAPDNNCVELAVGVAETAMRDSKDPDGGSFVVSASTWTMFLAHARSGGFGL
ncbi:DUF397 domain-containing protein [Lentzea sp. BCCO 10_0856]|uniref:DUF397 domain-containing protein n=1 Tax=Lentzea miocenica TaxID=3095431 RepID=A0ABU4TEF8_9PSEU|nr:DUF397 domain-containing protein [Lentzea sp. BCCO 10_0856]MDX8036571.1 DUF397 domain-containing protein [Lentzea sp. BCCO 10_0856]